MVITTGGVSVGEADFVKQLMAKLGEVLFWKIAMRPGRPMAFGRIGDAFLFGLPGNPVAVMVTFYQFVRDALVHLSGRGDDDPLPLLQVRAQPRTCARCRAAPNTSAGSCSANSGGWKVRTTGQQGSGVLRSMSEANCFIVLEHERGCGQGRRAGRRCSSSKGWPESDPSRARAARARREGNAATKTCAADAARGAGGAEAGCAPSIASAIRRATCATCSMSIPTARSS